MPETIIEICNSAITKVGGSAILSLDDDTVEARVCKLRYDPCRRVVLRRHPWNFAIGRVTTAPQVDAPAFGYTYAHPLPSDSLRVLEIGQDILYRIEGKFIITDANAVQLKYIKNIVDPGIMDELFGEALACYMAWDMAYKITQKQNIQDALFGNYRLAIRDAKSVDAQEERDFEIEANMFVDSRVEGVPPGRSNR